MQNQPHSYSYYDNASTSSYRGAYSYPEERAAQVHKVRSKYRKHSDFWNVGFYLLIICIIFFGLLQAVRSTIFSLYKINALITNKVVIEKYQQDTLEEHTRLQEQIRIYTSPEGIEELARNNLEMVGENEILVHLH